MSNKRKHVDSESGDECSAKENKVEQESKGLKIISWNVSGLRAWIKKDGLKYLLKENPDIVTLQETKCTETQLPEEIKHIKNYHTYYNTATKAGYSGVCLFSKIKPLSVKRGIGIEKHDDEGRVITAEYENFYLVATYVPNAGRGLTRLSYRQEWDKDLRNYLVGLKSKKPLIYCGDLNVAHQEIDLKNPKTNVKNAGFTPEERKGMTDLLNEKFVDSFRHLYPDKKDVYTFWTYMGNARARNVGWRLDYFILSEDLVDKLVDCEIHDKIMGSDHCPIVLKINI